MSNVSQFKDVWSPTYSTLALGVALFAGGPSNDLKNYGIENDVAPSETREKNFQKESYFDSPLMLGETNFSNAVSDDELMKTMSETFAKLQSRQQAHGEDFDEILHRSLWDLYES